MTVARSRVRTSPILSAVVACLFAGYVVALTPHLVHHLFDGDDDQRQAQCPHLAQSQHTPEAWSDPPPALSLPAIGRLAVCPDRTSLPFTERTAGSSRAPPATSSLA